MSYYETRGGEAEYRGKTSTIQIFSIFFNPLANSNVFLSKIKKSTKKIWKIVEMG